MSFNEYFRILKLSLTFYSKIFNPVKNVKSDEDGARKVADYIRLRSKLFDYGQTVVKHQ
ncbi:LOW QUALITY PROTEIN: hypothetical protein PanWU01x14_070130 [Parasponia andersonii]|uniref:Uncharacterized protein n=1 Tax=Parasponia andersonii TaxID=3476 RepID=A0A2P5DES9_PARAD|nr:LOW QUALITY PROTEIN: hypothetical protein PanWU01x14_070130 [Parasponia andersonii]